MGSNYLVSRILGSFRNFILFVLLIALFLGTGVGLAYLLAARKDIPKTIPATASVSEDQTVIGNGAKQRLTVNAELLVNGQFYLTPTDLPSAPVTGQLVFDKTSNTLQYYNGNQFIAVNQPDPVEFPQPEASVTSLQGQTGAVSLLAGNGIAINGTTISNGGILSVLGTTNQVSVTVANGTATLGLPQSIAPSSSPVFAGLNLNGNISVASGSVIYANSVTQTGAGQDVTIDAGSDDIVFSVGGRTFQLPTSGPASQTICTTGISCVAGGGQAVLLAPGSAQTDNTADASIFINDTGGGNILQLQSGGTDRFVVSPTSTSVAGSLNVNTITPSSSFSLGISSQQFTLSGSGASTITSTNAGSTTTVAFETPTANATINFPALSAGNYEVCTTANNCIGIGGSAPDNASYLTLGLNANLSSERVLTGGTNVSLTDGGANGNLTIATVANPTFSTSVTTPLLQSTGVMNITPGGTLTVGATGQQLTLQGNASTRITATNAGQTTTVGFTAPTANTTINFPALSAGAYTLCTSSGNCLGGSGGGANTSLSNLTAVAINTTLLPGNTSVDLGAGATPFRDLYLGGTVTNNFRITGTATAPRTITLPDAAGTIAVSASGNIALSAAGNISFTGQLPVANGGTGSNSASGARSNLGAAASGANADITSTTALNTITPSSSLTIGATSQSFSLQGSSASTLTAVNGAFTTTVGFITPTANASISFPALSAGAYQICTTSGNCLGGGSGAAPSASAFITLGNDASLTSERALTGGTNITLTDAGANSTLTIATVANPTFSTSVTTPLLQSIGVMNITPGGTLTVGATGQQLTLQGNGSTQISATASGLTTTVGFTAPTANTTINFPALSAGAYTLCTSSGNCLGGGSGGANTSLSNLSSVAINTSLLPGSTTIDLGAGATPFRDLYIGGTVTNNFRLTGSASVARTITLPDATGTLAVSASGNIALSAAGNISFTGQLPVANGGTGSNSASGARSNLGAAASGANADITSTSALNSIAPSGALTIGATNQSFTLQGSAASVMTATDSGFVTTVGFVTPTANASISFPALSAGAYQICTTSGNCLGGGSGGANTSLSNLSSVAINTSLLPGSTAIDLGSGANPFRDLYLGGTATNNFRFTGTATGPRTLTLPDETGTICTTAGSVACTSVYGSGGGSGVTTIGTIDSQSKSADGAVISGTSLYLQSADATYPGLVSTGTQTFAGAKTFSGAVTLQGTTTYSGVATDITTGTDEDLTITPNGTGLVRLGSTQISSTQTGTIPLLVQMIASQSANNIVVRDSSSNTIFIVDSTGNLQVNNTIRSLTVTSGDSSTLFIRSGNASAGNSGNVNIDSGTASGTTGLVVLGGTSASAITLGRNGIVTTAASDLTLTTGRTLTVNADAITDLTGTGLTVSGGALQATLGTDIDLASAEVTGTLPVNRGGTGAATFAQYGVLYGDGTNALQATAAGSTGQCLVATTGAAPSWGSCGAGISAVGTIDTQSKSSDGAVISGSTIYFQTADATNPGLVSTGTQTFAGAKTFSAALTLQGAVSFNGVATDITTGSNESLVIAPNGSGNVVLGTSDTTGTLLVVDTKTDAGDPTGANGGIYYNSNAGKFRCYQNSGWTDCIGTGDILNNGQNGSVRIGSNDGNSTVLESNNVDRLTITSGGSATYTGGTSGNAFTISNSSSTGNILTLQDNSTTVMSVADGGALTLQNSVDSSSAFLLQNAAGTRVLNVSTSSTSNLVANASLETNLNGWAARGTSTIAISTAFAQFGSRSLQLTTGTAANNAAGYNYQFSSSTQYSLSVWMRRSAGSTNTINIGYVIDGVTDTNCLTGQTVNTTWTQYTCTFTTGTVSSQSYVYIKQTDTTTDTIYIDGLTLVPGSTARTYTAPATALQVETASALSLLGASGGDSQPWNRAGDALPQYMDANRAVYLNGYIYNIGGDYWAGSVNTVYYAKVNSDGSVGSWSSATNIPAIRGNHTVVTSSGYIYVLGGDTGNSIGQSTVYYAKPDASGNISSWSTTTVLPEGLYSHSSFTANGYIYVIGGVGNAGVTVRQTVYYAKVNPDGTLGSWTTNANALPAERQVGAAVAANGYAYYFGGMNGSWAEQSTVYYAALNPVNGSIGSWTTASSSPMPSVIAGHSAVAANGYLYSLGGQNGSTALSAIYYAKLYNDGSISPWVTSSNGIPDLRAFGAVTMGPNGYAYYIGGTDNGGNQWSSVFYGRLGAVLSVGGSIDLVNLSGQNLADSQGGMGGSITAGNGTFVGTMQVQGAATFAQSIAVGGVLNVTGDVNLSATLKVLGASTFLGQVTIGTADNNATLVVFDTKNTSGDPSGVDGAIYYNSMLKRFRCFEGNRWVNCSGGFGTRDYWAIRVDPGGASLRPTGLLTPDSYENNVVNTPGTPGNDDTMPYVQYQTGTGSTGRAAGVYAGGSGNVLRLNHEPECRVVIRSGSVGTQTRFFMGFTMNNSSSLQKDIPENDDILTSAATEYFLGFYALSGGSAGTIYAVARNNTNVSSISTGVTYNASTTYSLYLRVSGTTAYFSVNGSSEVSLTTNLPMSQDLSYSTMIFNQESGVNKTLDFNRWQCEVN